MPERGFERLNAIQSGEMTYMEAVQDTIDNSMSKAPHPLSGLVATIGLVDTGVQAQSAMLSGDFDAAAEGYGYLGGFGVGTYAVGRGIGAIGGLARGPRIVAYALDESTTVTVGRWMSVEEYEAMVATGKVQAGSGGLATYVAYPADPAAYARQAAPGTIYVEFNVSRSSLKPAGKPEWRQIPGPDHPIYGPLADRRGLPRPQMPDATNINRWGVGDLE